MPTVYEQIVDFDEHHNHCSLVCSYDKRQASESDSSEMLGLFYYHLNLTLSGSELRERVIANPNCPPSILIHESERRWQEKDLKFARNPNLPEKIMWEIAESYAKFAEKLNLLENPNVTVEIVEWLLDDPILSVRNRALEHELITPEILILRKLTQ